MSTVTLNDVIADLITNFPPQHLRVPEGLPALAQRLEVLPLTWDMGGCMAVRVTGDVVTWPWDEEHQLARETDRLQTNRAWYQGAAKYPALRPFLPARPPDAEVCARCKGTGVLAGMPETFPGQFVCYCGGAGWLPARTGGG